MNASVQQLTLTEPYADTWCQRWHQGRHGWRRTSEGGFNPNDYRVIPIAAQSAARFIRTHHYSRTVPPLRFRYGLQAVGAPPAPGDPPGGALVGVLGLGVPMHTASLQVFDRLTPITEALELSRLVLLTPVPAPAESWFCARAFRLAARCGIRGVLAHSDPMPRTRTTADGGTELLSPGHLGHVYKVQDFAYLGSTRARMLTLLPDGTALADRAQAKVRGDERGHRGVETRLIALGARPRGEREAGRRWLAEALETVGASFVPHPGNHRYARTIGPRRM